MEVGFYSWSSGWPYRGLTSASLGLGRIQNESAFSTLAYPAQALGHKHV